VGAPPRPWIVGGWRRRGWSTRGGRGGNGRTGGWSESEMEQRRRVVPNGMGRAVLYLTARSLAGQLGLSAAECQRGRCLFRCPYTFYLCNISYFQILTSKLYYLLTSKYKYLVTNSIYLFDFLANILLFSAARKKLPNLMQYLLFLVVFY
jgi:hypothetical protein